MNEKAARIAKNTLALYVRMGVTMLVTLWSSRLILQALGVDDFGIYNVVAGVIILFTFLNAAMAGTTQRFLNFELGRKNFDRLAKVFSTSVIVHVFIAGTVLILSETLGLWFLNSELNIPAERLTAANWVYQFAIAGTVVGILRMPYNAVVIAYERMGILAALSIAECLGKFGIIFLLGLGGIDKLVGYAAFIFAVQLVTATANVIYCKRAFPQITKLQLPRESALFKEILTYSSWNLISGVAILSASQGVNMVVNIFCGVAVNAALGLANQVNGAVNQFVGNFQTAFQPQITKSYAENDTVYFMRLIFGASKISYALLLVLALPIFINAEFVLGLWLGDVPEHTATFVQLIIIFSMIDAVNGPLWMSIGATGDLCLYACCVSALNLLNLPLAYFLLKIGCVPETALIVRIATNLAMMASRLIILRKKVALPARAFLRKVCCPDLLVLLVVLPLPLFLKNTVHNEILGAILSSAMAIALCVPAIWILALDMRERELVKAMVSFATKKIFPDKK